MPEAEDDVLQRICAEVEADFWFEPPTKDNIQAFAKAVACRYAATVGAGGWRKITGLDFAEDDTCRLLTARSWETGKWMEPRLGSWDQRHDFWRGWSSSQPPTHCMDVGVPAESQA